MPTVALTGLQVVTAQGAMVPASAVSLVGQLTTSARGSLVPIVAPLITGRVATSTPGLLALRTDIFQNPLGVFATGVIGNVLTGAAARDVDLWARVAITDLIARTLPDMMFFTSPVTDIFSTTKPDTLDVVAVPDTLIA